MSDLPKLRIKKHYGSLPLKEHICTLDEARAVLLNYFPNDRWAGVLIGVEDELVHSFAELADVVNRHKDKEIIEVGIYPQSGGG